MLHMVGFGLVIIAVLFLRLRQIDGRISPDCQFYLNMAIGRPVPRPYSARVFVPYLTKLFRFLPFPCHHVMRVIVFLGLLLFLGASYSLVLLIGGSQAQALAAVVILLMTEALIGTWIMFPWLSDPWAAAFAVLALHTMDPAWLCLWLALAAISKEGQFAMAWAFCAVWHPALWWCGLPALALWALFYLRPAAPAEPEWLKHPVAQAHAKKRRAWFDYDKNIGHMKATPFAAIYALAGTEIALPALAACGLAFLQTMVAMDHARLVALASIFVVPFAVVLLPAWMLWVWVLLMLFWPIKRMEYA